MSFKEWAAAQRAAAKDKAETKPTPQGAEATPATAAPDSRSPLPPKA